jgi:hypothetical protein
MSPRAILRRDLPDTSFDLAKGYDDSISATVVFEDVHTA